MLLTVAAIGGTVITSFVLWLWLIDRAYKRGTSKAIDLSPHRWTDDEINKTVEKLESQRLDWTPHLPPKQGRRYIVVGGSGLVGGTIILQLLARGQSPKSIRNVDFRGPVREDLLEGSAAKVEWVHADITKEQSIKDAFTKGWDKSVKDLPITVFHTASLINAYYRKSIFWDKLTPVNITGTENVIEASKFAGADILIYTSTGAIPVKPVNHWLPPWREHHDGLIQPLLEPGHISDIRGLEEYFALYAASKARAEYMILDVNCPALKTGAIRPCNSIYANKFDLCIGFYMAMGTIPS
jgi:nucleoside-diphosphate-sugar epimerase